MHDLFLQKRLSRLVVCYVFVTIVFKVPCLSQDTADTAYYETFSDKVTGRIYTSRKFTSFSVKDNASGQSYRFEPNSTLNLGVGATYGGLTLNLAYGFGFLNPDKGSGDTKYLDLQVHAYPKNLVIDLFGQFYRGYYLDERGLGMPSEGAFYVSPDMRVRKIGANVQYLFNGDKLSLRASFLQSEWQKRSAGSFLVGFEMYEGLAGNDEMILPEGLLTDPNRNFSTFRFFEFGPNAGYVHTFVIKKNFFITGSATANIGVGRTGMKFREDKVTYWGVSPNLFLRGFVGYNSRVWSINANYVHNSVRLPESSGFSNAFLTGNYRINFVYRFEVGPKMRPYFDFMDLRRYLLK